MKLSKLINLLKTVAEENGDLDVMLPDEEFCVDHPVMSVCVRKKELSPGKLSDHKVVSLESRVVAGPDVKTYA